MTAADGLLRLTLPSVAAFDLETTIIFTLNRVMGV
jgi:hypothetical protein